MASDFDIRTGGELLGTIAAGLISIVAAGFMVWVLYQIYKAWRRDKRKGRR